MTREPAKNPAASIRARLLALAQSKGQDYQRVLGRYAIERFLYRLGSSTHRDRFALKGATLFTLWTGDTHRPTKDLDLLGWGPSEIGEVEETIRTICKVEGNDGILFDGESVEGTRSSLISSAPNGAIIGRSSSGRSEVVRYFREKAV